MDDLTECLCPECEKEVYMDNALCDTCAYYGCTPHQAQCD